MIRLAPALVTAALSAVLLPACAAPDRNEELVVFAAASLRDVMEDVAETFKARHEATLVFNFAGSNALAQQILAAPRGQIFVSADRDWVDALDRRGLVSPGSRRPVFTNRLVLIANTEARSASSTVTRIEELAELDATHLVVADPEAVPAGRYARAALGAISVGDTTMWQRVASRVVPTADVRSALALVESSADLLGIVYRTDADSSSRVRVICELETPPELPIAYWAVAIAGAPADLSASFLDFLGSPAARRIVERHGFLPPG